MERKGWVIIMNENDPSPGSDQAHELSDDEMSTNQVMAHILSNDDKSVNQILAHAFRDDDRSANQALARILKHDDESPAGVAPVGVGFLISPFHVITCAHVVNEALGLPTDTSIKPKARATLDFPLTKNNRPVKASVQQWHPLREHPCPGLIEDIAVLEIKATEVPEGVQPLSFVKLSERDIFTQEVRMFGFPEGYDNGLWSTGTIRGETGEGWYQIDHHPGDHVVTPGFSGAPALDKQDRAVGMIVCRRHLEGKTTAYIIPGSTIKGACQGIDLHVTGKPAFGGIIPKMCDRDRQDRAFWDFFCRRYKEFPNRPQFYICYGEEGECHRSLIDRLIDHRIKTCFGRRWKRPIMPYPVSLSWNLSLSLELIKKTLVRELIGKLEPGYMDTDTSGDADHSIEALSRLPVLKRYQLVMIVHDIPVYLWKKDHNKKLEWYLKDFWGCTEWPDDMPQFLIFLNIRYTGSQDAGAIKRILGRGLGLDRLFLRGIQKALKRIRESAGESCLLFDALEPVESNDVRRWFYDNMIKIDESRIMESISSVFKGKQRACMAKIEKELNRVYQLYLKDMSGLYE